MKNFDRIKDQLKELAEIVNSFKSEAVQLRIVELVFDSPPSEPKDQVVDPKPSTRSPRRSSAAKKKRKAPSEDSDEAKRSTRPVGRGARAALNRLVTEGFFGKPQTIRSLVEHCEVNLASKYKQSDFSGSLARLVRDGTLRRTKNSDNQYEYTEAK